MLCWEVEEGHEFLTIFLQAHSGLGVLCLIDFDEQIERSVFPAVILLGQSRLRRETVFADSPVALGPRRTLSAAPISPLEIPYDQ